MTIRASGDMLVSRLVYGIGMVHLEPIVVIDIEAACPADAGWRGEQRQFPVFAVKFLTLGCGFWIIKIGMVTQEITSFKKSKR